MRKPLLTNLTTGSKLAEGSAARSQTVSLARPLILHRMFGLTVEDVWEMMKESPHGERYMEKLLSVEIFGIV